MVLIDNETLWENISGPLTKTYGRAIIKRLRSPIRIIKKFHKNQKRIIRIEKESEGNNKKN